jgi:3-hexulose-6-phosphate synthase/6-phospho-3-hexuloisomerase
MKGKETYRDVYQVSKKCRIPIAVAGGLNSSTVIEAVKNGGSIIIVGGAITKAADVLKATQTIKQALQSNKKIATKLFKKYSQGEVFTAFQKVTTSNICDAMHNQGAIRGLFPLCKGCHLVGRALTVKTIDGDWAKPIEAIDQANKGNVIVVNAGEAQLAVWGELATRSCITKKVAGAVIDGGVRDITDIEQTRFPIFAKKKVPCAGDPKGIGLIGGEIICGGQRVHQGDWIIGDDTGIVVVPHQEAQEVANRAIHIHEWENRVREEIKKGSSLNKVLEIKKWEKIS